MSQLGCYLNQRRSYNGDLCTVRYVGTVEGTSGEWLGVEWDDPTRGKHAGQHQGVNYFTCKNKHPTAGSFVRPSRATDSPRGFLEALRQKYASEFEETLARQKLEGGTIEDPLQKPIEIGGKVVEEVGFDKIRKQLAELQDLKIVLVDGLLVAGILAREGDSETRGVALKEIEQTCPKIMELDLSRNLLERWCDVSGVCGQLKRLKKLKLNGNRFGPIEEGLSFDGITELHLDDTLLAWDEISLLVSQFPSLTTLSACANQFSALSAPITDAITTINLENNEISSLSSIKVLSLMPNLEHLSLRGNNIDKIYAHGTAETPIQFSRSLKSIDISRNKINTWIPVNQLADVFPGLETLRISGNPLFNQPVGPSSVTGMPEKPMTVDEAYMLTLSRLSSLQMLNYGKITAKDRTNGELYYLSLIGKELSASPESAELEILATHPRYKELCELHEQPTISRAPDVGELAVNPRSVAARLVKMVFYMRLGGGAGGETVKVKEIPRSFDTYQVKAIVSRLFNLTPFEFRLVWETDELDPVSKDNMEDDDGWDSEDEVKNDSSKDGVNPGDAGFVRREVELVDTTKDIGFWFESDLVEARIRVEVPPCS
ncbi:hypothetical protein FE257_009583 [Aspergillus nanangensis]|uniref:Tubulin-specific chaperone E n=1 Tax=Aspergillus nanangensis TaxID=2582783 RepID=A0AAD4CLH8_ASPNN|nr:hypothetical protein FE257_009583 [Aspergillus nanangensis]